MITAEQVDAEQVDAEQELASLCGVLNQSYARLVAIVAAALADESWAIAGVRSPEHWLTMRAGLSPFRAKAIVTVARRHGELSSVMAAFADGQLSFDQVAVVARYAPAHVEASVAELAVFASVPQLRRALSQYSFDPPAEPGYTRRCTTFDSQAADGQASDTQAGDVKDSDTLVGDTQAGDVEDSDTLVGDTQAGDVEDGDTLVGVADGEAAGAAASKNDPPGWNGYALEEDRSGEPAELSMSQDQYGRFTMRFSAPADLGALVEAALREAKDTLFNAGRPKVTFGDAMVEIAQRSLGAVESINRRDAYRTYVHLDTEGGWLTGQPRLPAHLAKKLTCDGILQPLWTTQGAPVNVGRAQRIVPTRTRRLVEDRDRGCRFPGCPATAHLECHHLTHWADGGTTDTPNLACLCPFHHDAHHTGDFTITGDADDPAGLTFTTRNGFLIKPGPTFTTPTKPQPPSSPRVPPGSPGSPGSARSPAPPSPVTAYRGPSGDTLSLRWVTFHEPREPAFF